LEADEKVEASKVDGVAKFQKELQRQSTLGFRVLFTRK
jgi:hypothetical protein